MESNGMYSNIGPGMLGLEMSLHHQIPPQQNPNHIEQQQPHHQPMVSFDHHQQSQPSARQNLYPYGNKPKAQGLTLSDEDEPAGGPTEQSSAEDGKRKMSPWQRMKWTDDMVRLLIMVVYYIGDEGAPDGASEKKGSHGILQKKGKWKSVSRAMMERGFSVSPQQCEDKFNDLNKRYKRVNDILGKGTACRVVENQSLLETMDLSPKMKEEVKKLLNSKHLFFREMCAYHNSCGGGGGGGSSEPPQTPQQKCLHSHEKPNLSRGETEGSRSVKTGEEEGESEDDEDDDVDDDHGEQSHEEEDDEAEQGSRKRQKTGVSFSSSFSPMVQQLSTELTNLCQDGSRNPLEKRHWIRARMMQLEEQQIRFDAQKLELEKQRLKWIKYSGKKEREMEKEKLTNERKRLENDRMVLLLQQKELELLDHLHHQRTSDPSSVTG